MTTIKAPFGGWVPLVNLDEGTPIPLCFVFQLPDKLTPSHITNGFCQAMVFDHILDVQTLDADRLVFTDNASREFVLIITPSVTHTSMYSSDLETGLIPVLGAFFLLGKATLGLRQLLFILVEELRGPAQIT